MQKTKLLAFILTGLSSSVAQVTNDNASDQVEVFRRSCWRESVRVEDRNVAVEDAVPYWLQQLQSPFIDQRQNAARDLAMGAIAGQVAYSSNIVGLLRERYTCEDATDDVGWEIKLNILTVLCELGDPKLPEILDIERRAAVPRRLRIVEMVEKRAYLASDAKAVLGSEQLSSAVAHQRCSDTKTFIMEGKLLPKQAAIQLVIEAFSNSTPMRVTAVLSDIQRCPSIVADSRAFEAMTNWYFNSGNFPVPAHELKLLKETIITCIALSKDSRAAGFLRLACDDPDDDLKSRAQRLLSESGVKSHH